MMRILGLRENELKKINGYFTCIEMINQPNLWLEGVKIIGEHKQEIQKFMDQMNSIKDLKIFLVGAGSSAKAASIVENYIRRVTKKEVHCISSTNLITQPDNYIIGDEPVLLVSFGSSGNTIEGLEAVEIFQERCKELYQLLIICSDEGEMVKKYGAKEGVLYIPIPPGTKGKSIAATGEFTLLIQYALLLFDIQNYDYYKELFQNASRDAARFFDKDIYKVHSIANQPYETIAVLGSNSLAFLAAEMCLKITELTGGLQSSQFHSVLEFRHGPKVVMNSKTLVSFFFSRDPLTMKYEIDMLKECSEDKRKSTIVAVSMDYVSEIDAHCDYYFHFNGNGFPYRDDAHIVFLYSLYLQSFSILKAVNLGISPDTLGNNADGFINKVAQGVNIYKK
jgi:tagatose-6-phosphate ketose/aldose isomerase